MIQVSNNFKKGCNSDTLTYREYIVINNQQIDVSAKMFASAYKDTHFIGTFNMKYIKFTTENDINYKKKELEYYKVVNGEAMKVGNFIVTDVEDNDSKEQVTVTAYDYGLKFAQPYQTSLNYESGEVTLYEVLQEICENVDVELDNDTITNGSFQVDSNQFVANQTYGDVVSAICSISCDFAYITSDNKLKLKFTEATNEIIEDYVDLKDKRDTQPITSVEIGMSQITGEETIRRDEDLIRQYGEHWLRIQDCPFSYTQEKREQLVDAIFNKVKGFGYSSFESQYAFKPYMELGDLIQFRNKEGQLVNSIVLKIETDYDNVNLSAPSVTDADIEYEQPDTALDVANRAEFIADQANGQLVSIVTTIEGENGINERINTLDGTIQGMNETILTQTADQFEMLFKQTGIEGLVDEASRIADDTKERLDAQEQYIRFRNGNIELGRTDSEVKLVLQNDRISFMTGNSESAYISDNQLYITDSTILRRLRIGHWVQEEDEQGRLNKRWVND